MIHSDLGNEVVERDLRWIMNYAVRFFAGDL